MTSFLTTWLPVVSLIVWLYLILAHGRFWLSGPQLPPAAPIETPDVDIIVPARDEAQTIRAVIASLLAQDYAGRFRVILVDDSSADGTAGLAGAAPNLTVLSGVARPAGWSGKLWALSQGISASAAPVVLLADADIVHDPRHLSALVARLQQPPVQMASEMVLLNCASLAERTLVPAFVYFFQLLYPFARVNDPRSSAAAASGGTVLIRRASLERIGGLAAIRGALIDDVTLAKAVKKLGPIYLGHSGLATSIRPYPRFADLYRLIARTAFTQLRHSGIILGATLLGLSLVWLVPISAAVFASGWPRLAGCCGYALATASYLPTLKRYRRSPLYALLLPLIAAFYMSATVGSALSYWFGGGASWKGRAYGSGH
jgi:hopene-associated glycosyltransferase HpnB